MNRKETDLNQVGISRRSFVGGGIFAASTAFLAGNTLAATGCAPADEKSGGTPIAGDFEVINTDLLIIGGGCNAQAAALSAIEKGYNVLVVDKGPYRHSGTSGMGWDAFSAYYRPEDFKDAPSLAEYPPNSGFGLTANQAVMQSAILSDPEPNKTLVMVNQGQTIVDRDAEGRIAPYYLPTGCQSQFVRRGCDDLLTSSLVNVMDRTIITDLLISNDRCLGAVGIHLPTGKYRAIRSNATIMAAGSSTWMFGWLTVSARSNSTSDSTGDIDAIAYRHGLGIGNSEFASYDTLSVSPTGIGYGFGTGITADPAEALFVTDKDGAYVFSEDDPAVIDKNWGAFIVQCAQAIADGRGTESGGLYVSIGDMPLRKANERNIEIQRKFGVDPRNTPIEVAPEMFEHGGTPITDENLMTELKGLFNGRSHNSGTGVWNNYVLGSYVGRCAVAYLQSVGEAPETDFSPVLEEIKRLDEIRTRKPDDGIRPHVIRHKIQETCYSAMGPYRSKAAIDAAIKEFERIREEDMPKMTIESDSKTFNIEWKQAIENYNLLDISEMSVRATLTREESRGSYIRDDFPNQDDDNWGCMLICYNKNGEMTFEKKFYDSVTW